MDNKLTIMFSAYPKFFKHLFEKFDHSKTGFSKGALFVLIVLKYRGSKGNLKMSELEHHAGLKKSTLSETVNVLVEQGYIHRERSKKDRRVVKVSLTDKGKEKAEKLVEEIKNYVDERLSFLTHDEREKLFNAFKEIEKVAEMLKGSEKKCRT